MDSETVDDVIQEASITLEVDSRLSRKPSPQKGLRESENDSYDEDELKSHAKGRKMIVLHCRCVLCCPHLLEGRVYEQIKGRYVNARTSMVLARKLVPLAYSKSAGEFYTIFWSRVCASRLHDRERSDFLKVESIAAKPM